MRRIQSGDQAVVVYVRLVQPDLNILAVRPHAGRLAFASFIYSRGLSRCTHQALADASAAPPPVAPVKMPPIFSFVGDGTPRLLLEWLVSSRRVAVALLECLGERDEPLLLAI